MHKNKSISMTGKWKCILMLMIPAIFLIFHLSKSSQYVQQEPEQKSRQDPEQRPPSAKMSGTMWEEYFSFLPFSDVDCKVLHESRKIAEKVELPEDIRMEIHNYKNHLKDVMQTLNENETEGNSGDFYDETSVYYKLASLPFVKTICETGFNAGHSTLLWLSAKPDTKVYSFDLGIHEYGPHMEKHLKEKFPGRLKVTWGDSSKTLPVFRRDHPDVRCDLVIIDGGHTTEIATADFDNFQSMANDDNIVVIDDYPSRELLGFRGAVGAMWERKKRTGEILEIFKCMTGPGGGRGFSLGRMLL